MPTSLILLDLQFEDHRWKRIPKLRERLVKAAVVTLAHLPGKFRIASTATVLFANDITIRRLNRDFRGFDKATNVLSFPQYEPRQLAKMGKGRGSIQLGDIALSYQYIVAEAKRDHKILINHVTHLLIHGLLHLFGYDHHSDAEAGRMERLEKKIMAELGLPDPYAFLSLSKGRNHKPKHRKPNAKR